MAINLTDLRRIAVEIAREEDPELEVLAATNGEGAADYAEIILALDTPEKERRRMVVGVSRPTSESQMRNLVRERIREQLATPE
jgi:hypothetical protein